MCVTANEKHFIDLQVVIFESKFVFCANCTNPQKYSVRVETGRMHVALRTAMMAMIIRGFVVAAMRRE